jgi:NADH-quinone oxidoreductase subunit M
MLILLLILAPLMGIIIISLTNKDNKKIKEIGLISTLISLIVSLIIFILFDFSNIDYQFVQEIRKIEGINMYIGIDGISIHFILLTTIIMPLVILSNWYSIPDNQKWYIIIIISFFNIKYLFILYIFWKYINTFILVNRYIWFK